MQLPFWINSQCLQCLVCTARIEQYIMWHREPPGYYRTCDRFGNIFILYIEEVDLPSPWCMLGPREPFPTFLNAIEPNWTNLESTWLHTFLLYKYATLLQVSVMFFSGVQIEMNTIMSIKQIMHIYLGTKTQSVVVKTSISRLGLQARSVTPIVSQKICKRAKKDYLEQ
jgi:hypothetical protein